MLHPELRRKLRGLARRGHPALGRKLRGAWRGGNPQRRGLGEGHRGAPPRGQEKEARKHDTADESKQEMAGCNLFWPQLLRLHWEADVQRRTYGQFELAVYGVC